MTSIIEIKSPSNPKHKIIYKNDKKYRIYPSGATILACTFDGCTSTKSVGSYCKLHKGGVVNAKPEKTEEEKKMLYAQYSENDPIDFLIIDVSELPGHFYVVPKAKLVLEGVFSSVTKKGITNISVPTPHYKGTSKYKWLLNYLDRWDLLQKN